MDDKHLLFDIDNEREWRKYLVNKMTRIEEKLTHHMAWNLVFRIVGSSLFAVLLIWMEYKLNQHGG